MAFTLATVTLSSMAAYSQSYKHSEPPFEGEDKEAFDKRTWLSKAHIGKNGTLIIPAASFHQALVSAAKYSKRQIPNQGKATWTAKFKSGIILSADIDTEIPKASIGYIDLQVDAKGMTGSAKSTMVPRRFPQVPEWKATFDVWIVDPIITREVFSEMVEIAGLFIGIGRWRPEMSGGMNGRFRLSELKWEDNRELKWST